MPQPRWFKIQQSNNFKFLDLFLLFSQLAHACDVPSAAGKLSLEYGKAYTQQIEIMIDFVRKKDDLNTDV